MQFKVGDRVEVLRPAEGTISTEANNIGLGTVERLGSDNSIKVKVDTNESGWWYERGDVRHAVEEIEIHPTPSITVGTQVRLTGVVTEVFESEGTAQISIADGPRVSVRTEAIEVIRQPFKRGEVVWLREVAGKAEGPEPYVVLNDESLGLIDVACCRTGFHIANDSAEAYERRP